MTTKHLPPRGEAPCPDCSYDVPSTTRHTPECLTCAEPRTAAGRKLIAQLHGWPTRQEYPWNLVDHNDILAIEREAEANATRKLADEGLEGGESIGQDEMALRLLSLIRDDKWVAAADVETCKRVVVIIRKLADEGLATTSDTRLTGVIRAALLDYESPLDVRLPIHPSAIESLAPGIDALTEHIRAALADLDAKVEETT